VPTDEELKKTGSLSVRRLSSKARGNTHIHLNQPQVPLSVQAPSNH
jgi:hypothetical protein